MDAGRGVAEPGAGLYILYIQLYGDPDPVS